MKSIKALGLVALTALALSAFSGTALASPSGLSVVNSGEGPQFHSEVYPAAINGSQIGKLKFVTDAGTTVCATTKFSLPAWVPNGKIISDTSELLLSPSQAECTLAGLAAKVTPISGCMYTFAVLSPAKSSFSGSYYLCETKIEVAGSACTVTIQPKTTYGQEYVNVGSGTSATVEVKMDQSFINYKVSGAEQCPFPVENRSYNDGNIKGAISLSAQS